MESGCSFYWVSVPRLRRMKRMSWLAALLAGALYCLTVCTTAFPGRSAQWIAQLSGLDVRATFERPLLFLFGSFVKSLPVPGSLALRFNLLAAILGAILVGAIFRLVWLIITEYMREESAIICSPRIARFASWATVICTATTLPVWAASTRFTPAILDAALFVVMLNVFFAYMRSFRGCWMFLFAIVYGAWMAESVVFVVAFPVVAIIWFLTEWIANKDCWTPRVWCSLMIGVVSYASDLLMASWQAATFLRVPLDREIMLKTVIAIYRNQMQDISVMLPSQIWIPVLLTGVLFGVAAFFVGIYTVQNYRTTFSLLAGGFLTVIGGYSLFNYSGTAWSAWAAEDQIPLFTGLCTTLGVGFLVATWYALTSMNAPQELKIQPPSLEDGTEAQKQEHNSMEKPIIIAGRTCGQIAATFLICVIILAALANISCYSKNAGRFADVIANRILDRMGDRQWIVANDVLDANLLLAAEQRKKKIVLLQPYRSGDQNYRMFIRQRMELTMDQNLWLRASLLLERNFLLFMEEIFLGFADMNKHAVTLSFADLWYSSGYQPVADGVLFYGIKKDDRLPDIKARLKEDEKLWSELAAILQIDRPSGHGLLARDYRDATLRQLSLIINNFGVMQDDAGNMEGAFQMYQLSRKFNPDNVSALLNLIDLVINRQAFPEQRKRFSQELEAIKRKKNMRYPVSALSRFHGYVRNPDTFLKQGLAWVASSSPDFVLATLRKAQTRQMDESMQIDLLSAIASVHAMKSDFEESRKTYEKMLAVNPQNAEAISGLSWLMLRQGNMREAYAWLMTGESSGLTKQALRVEWAVYYLASGDLKSARMIMDDPAVTKDKPALMALLGMIMIEQKELDQVEKVILPRLNKLLQSSGTDLYYAQILQARLLQAKGVPFYAQARACFLRAMAYRPEVDCLAEFVLALDAALSDAPSAELHAIQVLRKKPNHERGNFILGTFRLEKGLYADAELYLGRSIQGAKTASPSLNNYVEAAVRAGLFYKAEVVARRLTQQDSQNYKAWLLFADVLARAGKIEDATKMLARAKALKADDPKLAFVDARLAMARNQRQEALQAVEILEKTPLSNLEKRDLEALKKQIAE
jgi:tetratricopeptide (TPR) repeat protein